MKQTRVWRERIEFEKTSHDIKASLDDRHASIASGRVSGSSARVSAQHIRRHTRTHRHRQARRSPGRRPREIAPARRAPHGTAGDTNWCPVFSPVLRTKGEPALPMSCFFQSYQFGLRGRGARGYETDSDTALLCAPERSPSRPNRVDVLDSHVKRPDVSTSGYSGKPRSSSPGTKSGMMRMIGHPLLGE